MFAEGVVSVNRCVRFLVMVAVVVGSGAVARAAEWHFADWRADQSQWSSYSVDVYGQTQSGQTNTIVTDHFYTPDGTFTMGPPMGGTTYYRYKLDLGVVPPPNSMGCYAKVYYTPLGGSKSFIGMIHATYIP